MQNRLLVVFILTSVLFVLLFLSPQDVGVAGKIQKNDLVETETDLNGNALSDAGEVLFEDDEEGGEEEGDEDEEDGEFEDEYEEEDEAEDIGFAGSLGFLANFHNNLKDEVISLYWKNGETSEQVWLADIEPMDKSAINTFPNHLFVGIADESKITPKSHTMTKGVKDYHFNYATTAKPGATKQAAKANSGVSTTSKSSSSSDSSIVAQSTGGGARTTRGGFRKYLKYIDEKSNSVSAKFRCMCKEIDLWYDKIVDSNYQGSLTLGQEMTINTYEGHVFLFTPKGVKDKILAKFVMSDDSPVYEITDPDFKVPIKLLEHTEAEKKFKAEYLKKNGIKWRHYYGPDGPRGPPKLHMWPAQFEGQTHAVTSKNGYWTCSGNAASCQSQNQVDLTVEVMSLGPKAYLIENFISMTEADEIIRVAKEQVGESLVGNVDAGGARKSSTRTSRNAWVKRASSEIIKTIYLRAADVLQIPESILDSSKNAEDMQVVFYRNGQKYDSHHDWGVSGYPESRYITLLMYLTDQENESAGGETAFPKGAKGRGFKIHPGKGSAVLFYNILEDGNADDLALHAALPVHKGEKWLANFWVWDPKRK